MPRAERGSKGRRERERGRENEREREGERERDGGRTREIGIIGATGQKSNVHRVYGNV